MVMTAPVAGRPDGTPIRCDELIHDGETFPKRQSGPNAMTAHIYGTAGIRSALGL